MPALTEKPSLIRTGDNVVEFDVDDDSLFTASTGNGVVFVFSPSEIGTGLSPGNYYVNTWNAGVGFSDAALLTHLGYTQLGQERGREIGAANFRQALFVPGVSNQGACQSEASGSWFFWLDSDPVANAGSSSSQSNDDHLHGRRFTGTNLPRR